MKRVEQSYWDKLYERVEFEHPRKGDFIKKCLERLIPRNVSGKAVELGCYPGRYLSVLGDLGYELNGVDLTPKTEQLGAVLKKHGYKVGAIERKDVNEIDEAQKYDVVSSFGFIEHFENYRDILVKHANLVKSGGYLIIGAPNFTGKAQKVFHYLFDTVNVKRHVLPSMNPLEWAEIIQKMGFAVVYAGYCGGVHFSVEKDQFILPWIFGSFFGELWELILRILFFVDISKVGNRHLACYCLLVAKKQ
jgi:2-polyprenyl-3-methyl-5-hydroxy-6-metoxy-1,4-benzoquinol methylase